MEPNKPRPASDRSALPRTPLHMEEEDTEETKQIEREKAFAELLRKYQLNPDRDQFGRDFQALLRQWQNAGATPEQLKPLEEEFKRKSESLSSLTASTFSCATRN